MHKITWFQTCGVFNEQLVDTGRHSRTFPHISLWYTQQDGYPHTTENWKRHKPQAVPKGKILQILRTQNSSVFGSVLIGSITFILDRLLDPSYLKCLFVCFCILPPNACTEVLTKSPLSLGKRKKVLSIKCQDPLTSQKCTPFNEVSSVSVDLLINHSNTSISLP